MVVVTVSGRVTLLCDLHLAPCADVDAIRVTSVAAVVRLRMVCNDDMVSLQRPPSGSRNRSCGPLFLPRRLGGLCASVGCWSVFFPVVSPTDARSSSVGSVSAYACVHLSDAAPPDVYVWRRYIQLGKRPVIDGSAAGIAAGLPTELATFLSRGFLGARARPLSPLPQVASSPIVMGSSLVVPVLLEVGSAKTVDLVGQAPGL